MTAVMTMTMVNNCHHICIWRHNNYNDSGHNNIWSVIVQIDAHSDMNTTMMAVTTMAAVSNCYETYKCGQGSGTQKDLTVYSPVFWWVFFFLSRLVAPLEIWKKKQEGPEKRKRITGVTIATSNHLRLHTGKCCLPPKDPSV